MVLIVPLACWTVGRWKSFGLKAVDLQRKRWDSIKSQPTASIGRFVKQQQLRQLIFYCVRTKVSHTSSTVTYVLEMPKQFFSSDDINATILCIYPKMQMLMTTQSRNCITS